MDTPSRKESVRISAAQIIKLNAFLESRIQVTSPGHHRYIDGYNDMSVAVEFNKENNAALNHAHVARIRNELFGTLEAKPKAVLNGIDRIEQLESQMERVVKIIRELGGDI